MSEQKEGADGRKSDDEFDAAVGRIRGATERCDDVDAGSLAEEGTRDWWKKHHAEIDKMREVRKQKRLLVRNWFGRWMIWLYLVGRELPEMGPHAANRNIIWCTLGLVTLAMTVGVACAHLLHLSQFLSTLLTGAILYLLLGLGAFFSERTTNAPIHWTQNGTW